MNMFCFNFCPSHEDKKTNLNFFLVQFGESQKLRLVRILRSTVMVRVGGGWMALDEFLVKNDPCRGNCFNNFKSKMNIIYDQGH